MYKLLMQKRYIASLIFLGLLCGVLIACIEISSYTNLSLEAAFLQARDGYTELGQKEVGVHAIISSLHLLIFLPFVSKKPFQDFEMAKNYLLIRLSNIKKWYVFQLFQLLFYCFIVTFFYQFSLLAVSYLLTNHVENFGLACGYLIYGIAAGWMILYLLCLMNYVLALWLPQHLATMLMLGFTAVAFVGVCYLPAEGAQFYFLMNYYISWHMKSNHNSQFYALPTLVYYLQVFMIILAVIILGKSVMKKKDFI